MARPRQRVPAPTSRKTWKAGQIAIDQGLRGRFADLGFRGRTGGVVPSPKYLIVRVNWGIVQR